MSLHLVSEREQIKCSGIGRDAGNEKSLCFYFNRKPTDDEMRYLHDVMQRSSAERPSRSAMADLVAAIIQDEAKYDPATNTWDLQKAVEDIVTAFETA